jgi:hypothetical protein
MENRTCKACELVKSLDEFANAGTIKGVKYYRHLCVPCYSKSKLPRQKKIRSWFADYKKTLKCEECDNADYRVLEFHHKNVGDKEFNISELGSRSIENLKKEMKKCEVLCANCHRILHYEERKERIGE